MMTSEGMIMGAGGLAFVGNYVKQGRFPENGYGIITATVALVFLATFAKGSRIEPVVKAFAGLMLLAAVYRYIPAFTKQRKKSNG